MLDYLAKSYGLSIWSGFVQYTWLPSRWRFGNGDITFSEHSKLVFCAWMVKSNAVFHPDSIFMAVIMIAASSAAATATMLLPTTPHYPHQVICHPDCSTCCTEGGCSWRLSAPLARAATPKPSSNALQWHPRAVWGKNGAVISEWWVQNPFLKVGVGRKGL